MSNQIDRREFIGQSSIAGASVAAAGLAMASSARAQDSANEKVVVGVMGMSRGRSLARSFAKAKNVEVKYVCDVDITRAGNAAKEVEGIGVKRPQAIRDFRTILDDKAIDVLICAAPNHWHAPATILGCSAGKNVYVEKPCSHNPHEGEMMVAAARKHNRAVQMGTQRRSAPGTKEAIERLREGVIGRVYLARAWYNSARPTIGKKDPSDPPSYLNYELWQGPAPRRPYKSNIVHYNWHWNWHYGNGELGNNGVHTLDLCRWGVGVDFPTKATSCGGRYQYDDDQQTPDTQTVCFEFEGKRMITWEGLSCNRHGNGKFITFYGEAGAMELDSNGNHRVFDNKDKLVNEYKTSSVGDLEHIENFLTAIRTDKPLNLNAEIAKGHKSTLLCHLGNIAQRTGRTLQCDAKDGHILNDAEAMKLWKRDYEKGWEPKV